MSNSRPQLRATLALLLATLLAACSGTRDDAPLAAEPLRTHGFVSVEQHLSALDDQEPDTSVLFGVLRVPTQVSAGRMLRLMGMGHDLPEAGSCEVLDSSTLLPSPALSAYERVELLDVGDVSLVSKKSTKLARQAFPTVTDFISGVLYTSRERSAELDKDSTLTLKSRGSTALPAFSVSFSTLLAPEQLSLDQTSLAEVTRLQGLGRAELRWKPGVTEDYIWVELETESGRKSLRCAFDDRKGSGTLPVDLLGEVGNGRLTVHRIHRRAIHIPLLDSTELYLDVRISQPLVIY